MGYVACAQINAQFAAWSIALQQTYVRPRVQRTSIVTPANNP